MYVFAQTLLFFPRSLTEIFSRDPRTAYSVTDFERCHSKVNVLSH